MSKWGESVNLMLITISGPSGSGKTTVAKRLSEELDIPAVDVGQLFRELAKKRGMDVIAFGKYAEAHPEVDRELDARMVALARRKKRLILQGRLSALMARKEGLDALKIWVGASQNVRARRIAGREGVSAAEALRGIRARDQDNRDRYLKTYGLDANDRSVYDIVVPTDNRSVEQVVSILLKKIRAVWPTRQKPPKPKTKPKRALNRP